MSPLIRTLTAVAVLGASPMLAPVSADAAPAQTASSVPMQQAATTTHTTRTQAWPPSERCPSSGRITFRALRVPWWGDVTLYQRPSTRSRQVNSIPGYFSVRPLSRGRTWSKVTFNSRTGWVLTRKVSSHAQSFSCRPGRAVRTPTGPAQGA